MAEQCDLVKPEQVSKQTAYFIGSRHFISTGSIRQLRLSLPGKATLENHLAIAIPQRIVASSRSNAESWSDL